MTIDQVELYIANNGHLLDALTCELLTEKLAAELTAWSTRFTIGSITVSDYAEVVIRAASVIKMLAFKSNVARLNAAAKAVNNA